MRKTRLFIKVNNKWEEVELYEDIIIPVTLKVMNLKTFGQKSASYSSDIEIPHTSHNSQVFRLIEELNTYNGTFELSRNYEAYIEVDGVTTFSGQFLLKKIYKKRSGTYIYYVGSLYSNSKNFIDRLGNYTLTGNDAADEDLDFSEYDTLAADMQLANFVDRLQSFDTGGYDWGLTLIDKTNKAAEGFSTLTGRQQWYTDECTPYLHSIEIFNKIMSKTGYRYTSEFLSGDGSNYLTQDPRWADTMGKFNVYQMIYPYMKFNGNMHLTDNITNSVSQRDPSTASCIYSSQFYNESSLEYNQLLSWSPNFNSNDFTIVNTGTTSTLNDYYFTAPKNGYYNVNWNLNLSVKIDMRYTWNDGLAGDPTWEFKCHGRKQYTVYIGVEKNGRIIGTSIQEQGRIENQYFITQAISPLTGLQEGQIEIKSGTVKYQNKSLWLQEGDVIKLYCWVEIPVKYQNYSEESGFVTYYCFYRTMGEGEAQIIRNYYPKYIEVQITGGGDPIIENTLNDGFYEGNDFFPTAILNPKTTKLQYVQNFMKAFNLYIEDVSGKMNYKTGEYYLPNTLRIEPYELYYNPDVQYGSNVKDWTDKIDWESVEYRRVDEYLTNIQYFTKIQNGDYYNAEFNDTYALPYGNKEVVGPYCTSDDRNEIELKVSSTLCGIVNSDTDVLQCPKVFTLDNNNAVQTKKDYADGMFFIWNNNMAANTTGRTNYTVQVQSRLSAVRSTNITQYYCADTLNAGYGTDTANLNWGPTEIYYQNCKNTTPSNNDLFNAFYRKMFNDYTAPDARIMVADIHLNSLDIANFQMSDIVIVDGVKWRCIEIKEWKNEDVPAEITLVKILPEESVSTRNTVQIRPRVYQTEARPLSTIAIAKEVSRI